ncbi:MAG: gliding motility-associated C-terminal domain-containing protein [Cytophaga sp.]|uniref:T9SS type B sorting domain-containing protein n=1 Tax=Cytophaga sp. TaxID=29535 RepID=UPI003F7E61CB
MAQMCSSPSVSMSVTTQNLRCNGDKSGSIAVTISGGSTPLYTYSLYSVVLDPIIVNNYPINNYTFSNLPADNNYFLVIQVPIGGGNFAFCSQSITLTEPPPLTISTASITNVSCNGGNNGAIDATVTGGPTMPYTYSWSNGATTEDISGLTAGTYTLTIIDGNNCTTSQTFTVTEPAPLTATAAVSQITCNGANNGSITLTPAGGTAPYSNFVWSNGATTQNISGLVAGTYTVTFKDSKGCTGSASATVNPAPAVINATANPTQISCNGANDGAITLTISGGTAPYSNFVWSNGATTQNISGLVAGTYTVTFKDNNGCNGSASATINPAPAAVTATATPTQIVCNGGTGSITLTPAGGTAPYSNFVWSNGATTQNISGLTAGSYTVTFKDSKGCTGSASATINPAPTAITATATPTQIACNGGTGSIALTPAGGTPPYSNFLWSNGATTQNISGLSAGTYTVSFKDSKGCTGSASATINAAPATITATPTVTQITCNGASNGSISLTLSGGTAPYNSFLWSNGATTQNISGLAAGTYTVVFKDNNGCSGSASATVNPAPAAVTATATPTQITCNGGTGSITLTPAGGTAPYGNFVWSNGATTQNISGLAAGTYTVTFKDNNGCSGSASATINPAPPAVTATATPTQITCNGGTGSITLTPSGGTAPYSNYIWSNGAITQNISGLAAGTYTVTFKDNNGCTGTASATINPAPAAITATATPTQISCNGGTGNITLTPSGGTPPYSNFVWSNGATTQNISGLTAGTYTVTFKDSKGCTGSASATINPAPAAITATATPTQITCNSGTGSITLTPAGGTAPYSNYIWSNGATTQNISGLAAGTYTVTFKDNNGCSGSASATINPGPTAVTATAIPTQITCNGGTGSITLTPSGGTAPYSNYLWSNGATTQNISGLTAGTYTVTFKDNNGCTGTASATINPAPAVVIATATPTQITCNGANNGSIALTPSGGTAPYSNYIWSNGATTQNISGLAPGTYIVTFKDSKGCTGSASATINPAPAAVTATATPTQISCSSGTGSITLTPAGGTAPYSNYLWSNGATTQNISGLAPGTYTVTFKDSKGCTGSASATINPAPAAVTATATPIQITCNGGTGSITLTPTGGTAPYSNFVWSNGATTQNISGLTAGTYTVTFKDNGGCNGSASATINPAPAAITATGVPTSPSCKGVTGGSIVLTPGGGTAPYKSYAWSDGSTSKDLMNVPAGTYTVVITDNNNCISAPISFIITDGIAITGTATANPTTICSGDISTVTAAIDPAYTPAPNPYSFNGGTTFQNSPTFTTPSIAGDTIIHVLLKDINGCLSNDLPVAITTTKINGATIAITNPITCHGGAQGEITVTVSGNSSGYTYSINGSAFQSSGVFSNLPAGAYTVVIDDGTACKSSVSITLTEPAALTIGIKTSTDVNPCTGGNNGSIQVTTNGGNGSNIFTLNPTGISQTDSLFSNLDAGTYTVTVTDSKNCSANTSVTINTPAPISIVPTNHTDISCTNPTSGSIDITVTGGIAPYAYQWSNGSTTEDVANLTAGVYKVIVTDSKNCKDSLSITIIDAPVVTGTATASPAAVCSGQGTTVTAAIDPAFTPDANAYSFDGGITFQASPSFPVASIIVDTTVNVVLKDINGCLSNPIVVSIATIKIVASIDVTKPVSCNGNADGEITVTVSGSSAGYTYSIDGTTFQSSNVFTNLAAGSYTIIIDDGTSCKSSYPFTLTEPSPLTLAIKSTVNVNPCAGGNNGSITVTTNGGNGSYLFTITPPGSSQTDSLFATLKAGSYTIKVTDAKGCTATTNATLTQPVGIDTAAIVATIVDNKCPGDINGSVKLSNVTGGASPYTYTLNGTTNSTSIFTGLASGQHSMLITDNLGCSINYLFKVNEPEPIIYTAIPTPSSCNKPDGSIEITNVTGGTPPYKYSINDGQTYVSTSLFTNLGAGVYHLRVSDNQCSYTKDATIDTKTAPVPYIRIEQPTCNSGGNGFVVIDSLSGGVPLFQYNFNGIDVGSTTVYSNLKAGSYSLQITDQACTYDIDSFYVYNKTTALYDTLSALKITITEPQAITATIETQEADRYNNTGAVLLHHITGGTPGYAWSTDNITYTPVLHDSIYLSYLHKGNHTIYVQDTNSCVSTFDIVIHVQFFIPNLITPNKDGKNDRFEIMALPVGSELKIVNRWGNQVYSSDNYDNSWDADEDSDGVYYYELTLPNGDRHKGWVDVIR